MSWRVCLCDDGVEAGDDIIDVYNIGEVSTPELIGDMGLDLTTTRDLLGKLQAAIVALQEDRLRARALAQARSLPGVELKDYRPRRIQTLFGEVTFSIPRLRTRDRSKLFVDWPKHARAHPELDYVRAQFCAWMSFGKAQKMLDRMFPVNVGISGVTLHRSLGKVASVSKRQIDADEPADTMILPIDTTFVRGNSRGAQRKMEVMVGAVEPDRGDVTYFSAPASMAEACVEIGKSHMRSAGWTPSTKLVALTDGGRNVQSFAARMGAIHRPITDWFHISMRIQHVEACAGAFPAPIRSMAAAKKSIVRTVERMRHRLWNGHAAAVKDAIRDLEIDRKSYSDDPERKAWDTKAKMLKKGLRKLREYTQSSSVRLANYAARHRAGDRVGTFLVEGGAEFIVNARMARSQHMRWSEQGAYNLLQVRTRDTNGTLERDLMAA